MILVCLNGKWRPFASPASACPLCPLMLTIVYAFLWQYSYSYRMVEITLLKSLIHTLKTTHWVSRLLLPIYADWRNDDATNRLLSLLPDLSSLSPELSPLSPELWLLSHDLSSLSSRAAMTLFTDLLLISFLSDCLWNMVIIILAQLARPQIYRQYSGRICTLLILC